MGIIQVSLSDQDRKKYGLNDSKIAFEDLLNKISAELARQAMHACQDIAERAGVSQLTLDEINAEIKAVRQQNAKHHFNSGHEQRCF